MYQLFTSDSPIIRFLRQLSDLFLLNLCFLLGSLPLFTVGASLSALYSVLFAQHLGREPAVWHTFWLAWKRDLRASLPLWLPMLAVGVLLAADCFLLQGATGALVFALRALLGTAMVLYLFVFCYLFALLSEFENTVRDSYFKALYFSVRHFPTTILLCILTALPWLLASYSPRGLFLAILLMLSLGFSLQAALGAPLLLRIFRPYLPEPEPDPADEDADAQEPASADAPAEPAGPEKK